MEKLAELLGLSAPFAAAAGVYGLFNFLDKRASDAANKAIVGWIGGKDYKRLDLGSAVISAFNHLYGTRLFTIKAFIRSAILSLVSLAIYYLLNPGIADSWGGIGIFLGPLIIIVDYLSLFAIRKILSYSKTNLWVSISCAFACGVAAMGLVTVVFSALAMVVIDRIMGDTDSTIAELIFVFTNNWDSLWFAAVDPGLRGFVVPAAFVHVWLPLFLVGAVLNSVLNAFFIAVGTAQWFLKRGENHALEAIGMTAGFVVFVTVAIYKAFSAIL